MSYVPGLGRAMNDLFESSAEGESLDLPSGEFVARNGKAFKIALIIASIFATVGGALIYFFLNEEIAIIFLALGILMLLILPTILTYKCLVNKTVMIEKYFILFFKRTKEIQWSDVKYRKIRIGNNNSIKLYDKNKKHLISFDGTTVGFNQILKLAKRSWIVDLQKSFSQKVK